MRLISRTGIEGPPVSSLNCDSKLRHYGGYKFAYYCYHIINYYHYISDYRVWTQLIMQLGQHSQAFPIAVSLGYHRDGQVIINC